MENKVSPKITEILNYGKEEAVRLRCSQVEPAHLLLALMREKDCTAMSILRQMGVDFDALKQSLEKVFHDIMEVPYHLMLHYNGLDEQFTVRVPVINLVTLDKSESGTEESVNQTV